MKRKGVEVQLTAQHVFERCNISTGNGRIPGKREQNMGLDSWEELKVNEMIQECHLKHLPLVYHLQDDSAILKKKKKKEN